MLHNPEILPKLMKAVREFHGVIQAALYSFDEVMTQPPVSHMRKCDSAKLCVLLDKGQVTNPSCATQRKAMFGLRECGGQFQIRRPSAGVTTAQSETTWLFVDALLFCGSANATWKSCNECE